MLEKRGKVKLEEKLATTSRLSQEMPSCGSWNGVHLSLLAARFRSLTVKHCEEAARETEADPLPMAALDFAGLIRSENNERIDASIVRDCTPGDSTFFCDSTLQKRTYVETDKF